eukprot:839006-Amphidinium_carterae.1
MSSLKPACCTFVAWSRTCPFRHPWQTLEYDQKRRCLLLLCLSWHTASVYNYNNRCLCVQSLINFGSLCKSWNHHARFWCKELRNLPGWQRLCNESGQEASFRCEP